jgi:hypothetical protein
MKPVASKKGIKSIERVRLDIRLSDIRPIGTFFPSLRGRNVPAPSVGTQELEFDEWELSSSDFADLRGESDASEHSQDADSVPSPIAEGMISGSERSPTASSERYSVAGEEVPADAALLTPIIPEESERFPRRNRRIINYALLANGQ